MKSVGIIFGRFNPPHKGHRVAWQMASENNYWYVGTNKNTIGPKDPLPYDTKIEIMEAIWPKVKEHIVSEQSWLTLASMVYKTHGNVKLNVYTDEAWVYKALVEYNNIHHKPHGFYSFDNLALVLTPRLSSATDLRNAAITNDPIAFELAAGVDSKLLINNKSFFEIVAKYLKGYNNEHRRPKEISRSK